MLNPSGNPGLEGMAEVDLSQFPEVLWSRLGNSGAVDSVAGQFSIQFSNPRQPQDPDPEVPVFSAVKSVPEHARLPHKFRPCHHRQRTDGVANQQTFRFRPMGKPARRPERLARMGIFMENAVPRMHQPHLRMRMEVLQLQGQSKASTSFRSSQCAKTPGCPKVFRSCPA